MVANVRTKYESDTGTIHPLQLSPAIAAVAGTEPTNNADSPIKAKLSKTNREHGLRPRTITVAKVFGTAPDTFVRYKTIPLRSATDIANAAYQVGATLSIDGEDWDVASFNAEDY